MKIEKIYKKVLEMVETIIGHNETTSNFDLNKVGNLLFGSKFLGCYPIDKIPKLNNLTPYCILNLDTSRQSGSHWISVVFHNDKYYIYDSFARCHTRIIDKKYTKQLKSIINTDLKESPMDQKILQSNCGQRCLTALYICDNYGIDSYLKL